MAIILTNIQDKDLIEENKESKLQNINTDNYEEWSVNEVIHWIISLDPDNYGQYEERMRKVMIEEDVTGYCLDQDVDIKDMTRWGVTEIQHSKAVLKAIKALI